MKALTKILCLFFVALLPCLAVGQTGTQPRQIEAVDTQSTGVALPTYEDWIMISELDTIGLDDYRYHHNRLALPHLFFKGDSICHVLYVGGDTSCVMIPEPTGGPGDTLYYWVFKVNSGTGDTIVKGELINLVAGTNISITGGTDNPTINALVDTCIHTLSQLTDSTAVLLDCNGVNRGTVTFSGLSSTEIITIINGQDTCINLVVNNGILADTILLYKSCDSLLIDTLIVYPAQVNETYVDSGWFALDTLTLYRYDTTGVIDSFKVHIVIDSDTDVDSISFNQATGILSVYEDDKTRTTDLSALYDNDTVYQSFIIDTTTALFTLSNDPTATPDLLVLPWRDAIRNDYSANYTDSIRHNGYVGINRVPIFALDVQSTDVFGEAVARFYKGTPGTSTIRLERADTLTYDIMNWGSSFDVRRSYPFSGGITEQMLRLDTTTTGRIQHYIWHDNEGYLWATDYGQGYHVPTDPQDTFAYILAPRGDGKFLEVPFSVLIDSLSSSGLFDTDSQNIYYNPYLADLWLSRSSDTVTLVLPWLNRLDTSYNASPSSQIWHQNKVLIDPWSSTITNAMLRVAHQTSTSSVAEFDNTIGTGATIDIKNDKFTWRLGQNVDQTSFRIINWNKNPVTYPVEIDTTASGRAIHLYSNDVAFNQHGKLRTPLSTDSITHLWGPKDLNGVMAVIPVDSLAKVMHTPDYDFVRLIGDSSYYASNMRDTLLPNDTTALDSLMWRPGIIRLADTMFFKEAYDPNGFTQNFRRTYKPMLQIADRINATEAHGFSYVYDWRSIIKGDWSTRLHNYDTPADTVQHWYEIGVESRWRPSIEEAWDTTYRQVFRISSHTNSNSLILKQDSIQLGDYTSADIDSSITSSQIFALYVPKANGVIQLALIDTVLAALEIAASTPDITYHELRGDTLGLNLNATVDTAWADLSKYNVTISGDSIYQGGVGVPLPAVADSLGQIHTNDYPIIGTGTRSGKTVSDLYIDRSNNRLYTPRQAWTGDGLSTEDSYVKIGGGRSGDGNSFLDFNSTSTISSRLIRTSGANGNFNITNWGTGAINYYVNGGTASASFESDLDVTFLGYGAGAKSGTFTTVAGFDASGVIVTNTPDVLEAAMGGPFVNTYQDLSLGARSASAMGVLISSGTGTSLPAYTNIAGAQVYAGLVPGNPSGGLSTQYLGGDGVWRSLPDGSSTNEIQVLSTGTRTPTNVPFSLSLGGGTVNLGVFTGTQAGMVPGTSAGSTTTFLRGDGTFQVPPSSGGTVTSVAAGNGMDFTTITGSGSVTLGTPGSVTLGSTNSVSATSHTHAFAPGGSAAQYIKGDGTLGTYGGGGDLLGTAFTAQYLIHGNGTTTGQATSSYLVAQGDYTSGGDVNDYGLTVTASSAALGDAFIQLRNSGDNNQTWWMYRANSGNFGIGNSSAYAYVVGGANTKIPFVIEAGVAIDNMLRVDASGVGIGGVTSPAAMLDVNGSLKVDGGASISLNSSGSTTIDDNAVIGTSANPSEQLEVLAESGGTYIGNKDEMANPPAVTTSSFLFFGGTGAVVLNADEQSVTLSANGTGGFIRLSGSTSSSDPTQVDNYMQVGTTGAMPSATHKFHVAGTSSQNTTTLWAIVSDKRVKEHIKPIHDSYEKLMKLNPVTFRYTKKWIEERAMEDKVRTGFIAQEYAKVFPTDVDQEGGGMLDGHPLMSLHADAVAPYTVAAVQQLIKDKTALESSLSMQKMKIDQLIGEIVKLSNRITTLENGR